MPAHSRPSSTSPNRWISTSRRLPSVSKTSGLLKWWAMIFEPARRLGVVNTPTFIVNNEYLVVGARPYEYWDQLINVLLQAANE